MRERTARCFDGTGAIIRGLVKNNFCQRGIPSELLLLPPKSKVHINEENEQPWQFVEIYFLVLNKIFFVEASSEIF
jgi:hypothetical protein